MTFLFGGRRCCVELVSVACFDKEISLCLFFFKCGIVIFPTGSHDWIKKSHTTQTRALWMVGSLLTFLRCKCALASLIAILIDIDKSSSPSSKSSSLSTVSTSTCSFCIQSLAICFRILSRSLSSSTC